MKVKKWKQLKRHEESAKYPDIQGRLFDLMVNSIDPKNPPTIYLWGGMVLEGWQRHRACLERDIMPNYKQAKIPEGMTPEAWVQIQNDHRRHETQEEAIRRIEGRRQRVAEARAKGESIRAIADAEGVSDKTVRDDLSVSQVSTPTHVTGRDGKQYGGVRGWDGKTYTKRSGTKNGKPKLDWKRIEQCFAVQIRELDVWGDHYKCRESIETEKIRSQIGIVLKMYRAWAERLSGEKLTRWI
jgi:hypothetical protein